jgi:hypothetical protein
MITGGVGGGASDNGDYNISYNVAAMVRSEEAATATSAHADHQGQASLPVSFAFAISAKITAARLQFRRVKLL